MPKSNATFGYKIQQTKDGFRSILEEGSLPANIKNTIEAFAWIEKFTVDLATKYPDRLLVFRLIGPDGEECPTGGG